MNVSEIKNKYCTDKRMIPRTAEEIYNKARSVQRSSSFENATGSTLRRMRVVSANRELKEKSNEFVWNRINQLKEEIKPLEVELKKKKSELEKLERESKGRNYQFMKK